MNTRRTLAALVAASILGCGPTTINVTTSDGEGGESSDAPDSSGPSVGSTGIGGSESGLDTSATTGASSSGSSDPSSGGGSSSTGEPPSECFMVEADAGPTCLCDGIVSTPTDCGCFVVPESGECWCGDCPNGGDCQEWPGSTCTPCEPAMEGERCECGGEPVDPVFCGCALDAMGACNCDDGSHPPESCGWTCAPSGPDPCVCGNFPAPDDWCALTCDIDPTTAECTCPVVFVPPACWCGEIAVEC